MVDRELLLERAEKVGAVAASHAGEAEAQRRVPDAVIEELVGSGLLRLVRPKRFDGLEVDPVTYVEVLREVARGDVTAGWLCGVLSVHEWVLAYTSAELQREVWSETDPLIADSLAPVGTAEPVSDGFVVSGRWRFLSGVEWCGWASVCALVMWPGADHPEPCTFYLPRSDFVIEDEWHVIGLKGTASNAITLERVFVPEHRMLPLARVAATGKPLADPGDGPLFKVPFAPMLSTSIFPAPLGGAQRALEEFRTWTTGRVRPFAMGAKEVEAPSAQLALAETATRWDAAYALGLRYAQELQRLGEEGTSSIADTDRARFFAWRAFIARTSAEVTERLFNDSGGNSIFESHAMQRVWRDTHAAAQHVTVVYGDGMTSFGRTQVGLPGHPFL